MKERYKIRNRTSIEMYVPPVFCLPLSQWLMSILSLLRHNATVGDDYPTSFICRVGFVTIATLCIMLIVLEPETEQGTLFPLPVLTQ
jgi:hypothetical protein